MQVNVAWFGILIDVVGQRVHICQAAEFLKKLGEAIRNLQLSAPEAKHCHVGRAVDRRANTDLHSLHSGAEDGKDQQE